ncbi:hypothetical protein O4H52_08065 [Sphingomonadaceae bacterium G21617-S1]|nr:hypothetical protein [Sphingomonadaceae bacterium G21617-S1]
MMVRHVTIPAVAARRFPHGSPVRVVGHKAHLETDLAAIDGVTKRPPQAGDATEHEPGEQLLVLTDGYQLSAIGGQPVWTVLAGGKIQAPARG